MGTLVPDNTVEGPKRGGRPTGTPKSGGRKKGTPNKATADVKRVAQEHTTECIRILMEIARTDDYDPRARVSACKEILDRGHGRPREHATVEAGERLADLVLRGATKR